MASNPIMVVQLVERDDMRVKALECVYSLMLPQCYIAAGFVRNLVWDHLHGYEKSTALNDVDVIYFDGQETDQQLLREYEHRLTKMMPELNWQVRNQAWMHVRNNDKPYSSSLDAMSHWVEKETAVAIRKRDDGEYECLAAFGWESLWALELTHNPKRSESLFIERVTSKGWLTHWPKLKVVAQNEQSKQG
ncbi:nucleotidyltransferase family protein [Vibrio sp. SCSIO 43135]|uniref:nucleotidyltransferase family protein n=1 Tax=Vibrio sp. SCSIO 43135 TaxID=2819096 RepID=UPI00207508B2|nr:nucleotidyltransferase family protein [Vibrio sp. SCSIO 43135]USD43426.1 nucleotidyltransferase family protein [Vibrio sp. SCSIO 43135]